MSSYDDKTPIVALCGFLGAGKTTLLNHILSTQNGRKIAVIVNDFGAVNVDSMLITSQTEDTVELSNGSICCVVGEDGIEEVIGSLAHKYSIIDMIIIEASGAAEPTHLVQSLSRLKNEHARFDSLLYVVDAYEYEKTVQEHPEINEHIEGADCIVLNKMDSLDATGQTQLKSRISDLAPRALMLESSFGKVDVEVLLGSVGQPDPEGPGVQLSLTSPAAEDQHDHSHVHDKLQNVTFRSDKPMDPKALLELFDDPPAGVYRLKGWIDFGRKGEGLIFIVQLVGTRWRMHVHRANKPLENTELLVIGGHKMVEKKVLASLEACVDEEPDDVRSETILFVPKYDR